MSSKFPNFPYITSVLINSNSPHYTNIDLLILSMAFSTFTVVSLLVCSLNVVYGGWENAHATFYGGGDATGTMGKCYKDLSSNLHKKT